MCGVPRQNQAKVANYNSPLQAKNNICHFPSDFGFLHECMQKLFDFNKITPKFDYL